MNCAIAQLYSIYIDLLKKLLIVIYRQTFLHAVYIYICICVYRVNIQYILQIQHIYIYKIRHIYIINIKGKKKSIKKYFKIN